MSFDQEKALQDVGFLFQQLRTLESFLQVMHIASTKVKEEHFHPEDPDFSVLLDVAREQVDELIIKTEDIEQSLKIEVLETDSKTDLPARSNRNGGGHPC